MEDFKYNLLRWWISFTYIFRKPYYRYKLLRRMGKHWFPGPWDLSEFMFTSCFEIFCEYYECMDPENTWISPDPEIQAVRSELIYLYNWYTKERVQEKEDSEYLSNVWWSHESQGEDSMFGGRTKCLYLQRLCGHLLRLHMEEDLRLYEKEQENFMRLMKVRTWLTD